jgi:hypothetical protein
MNYTLFFLKFSFILQFQPIFWMLFILFNVSTILYDVCADPNEKVINRAKKLNNGNDFGKAKEVLLTSFVNETNGTVLDVPNKSINHPPWDLLSKRNIENLQRLIMEPNPPAPKDIRVCQKRLPSMWQKKKNTCIGLLGRKMKMKKARQRYQDEMRGKFSSVPEYLLHVCRVSVAPSPIEQFLRIVFVICGAVCWAAIIPGFVLHLFSRHGVCKYSYYSGVRLRPCVRRPRVARTGAFTFAGLKVYFCSLECGLVGEMIKKIGLVWKRGSGSAGRSCRRSSKKPGRARTSKKFGRGQRSAARRARACTSSSVLVLVVLALSCVIGGVQAVFTPADNAAFTSAKSSCLSETGDGSCPIFAASNVTATGNPYGVMGDWDMSKVTSLSGSTSTPPSFFLLSLASFT